MAERQTSVDYGKVSPWYFQLSEVGRAKVDSRLRDLAANPNSAAVFHTSVDGKDFVYEVAVRADGNLWRIVCVADPVMGRHVPALIVLAVREIRR